MQSTRNVVINPSLGLNAFVDYDVNVPATEKMVYVEFVGEARKIGRTAHIRQKLVGDCDLLP